MKICGHADVRLMNGGRKKWVAEGREVSTETSKPAATAYKASPADVSLRSMLPQVQAAVSAHAVALVDVRSPQEFSGEILAPPGLPETGQRGGPIPGAGALPWCKAVDEGSTVKSYHEVKSL